MKKITTNSKNGGADVQGGNGEALPDIERSVQAMNLLPQVLDFQGILFGHPSRLIDGREKFGMIRECRLIRNKRKKTYHLHKEASLDLSDVSGESAQRVCVRRLLKNVLYRGRE